MKIRIFFISISIFLIFSFVNINQNKDYISIIKSIFPDIVVFQLKKLYIIYVHDFKNRIILEKQEKKEIVSNFNRSFELILFKNNIFKKNGPKVFIERFDDNIISITGTGILSYSNLNNFRNEQVELKIIRNNLRKIFGTNNIVSNPGIVLNMKVYKDYLYISYVNEIEKDCYNTSVLKGKINLKRINFETFFVPDACINKKNSYGEFFISEAGGALELIDEDKLLLSTGTFRFRDKAQQNDNIFGKILLIQKKKNLQTIKIVSMGHRNVQGMFFDNKKNILFTIDHGPQGGDEINLVYKLFDDKIKNFGWPISSYGEHYGGKIQENEIKYKKAPLFKSHLSHGFVEPHKYFVPSIGPSNIILISNSFDQKFRNNIYLSSLGFNNDKGRRSIHSFFFDENNQLIDHEIIPLKDRVRDIEFIKETSEIYLFLEMQASIGILKKL